ncbi:TetR family transcriptional regulator, partial [Kibdelosporangium lantanae]
MPRVSQDHLDARRRQILAGARTCFARFGYEGATVRRLEEATNLSRGAIFHHFRDKESLFLALAEDESQPLLERAKFLAIFASNLDEFYMVRVAGLKLAGTKDK